MADGVSRRGLLGLGLNRLTPTYLDRLAEAGGDESRPRERPATVDAWVEVDPRPLAQALAPAVATLVDFSAPVDDAAALAVAAADGDVALELARRGADVVACEASPALVRRGRDRCPGADWHPTAATRLPFPDASFDLVVAPFGVTEEPLDAIGELFRVARPGALVAVAAWSPAGLMGEVIGVLHRAGIYGAAAPRPSTWGRYETVYREFMSHTSDFDALDREMTIDCSPAALWGLLADSYAPLVGWIRRSNHEALATLRRDVEMIARLYDAQRREGTGLPAAYVVNYGRKPG